MANAQVIYNLLAAQSQGTPSQLAKFIGETRPGGWLFYSNALNRGLILACMAASPSTAMVGRLAVAGVDNGFTTNPVAQANSFADAVLATRDRIGIRFMAWCGINEPVIASADEAKQLDEWQVTYNERMHAAGERGEQSQRHRSAEAGHEDAMLGEDARDLAISERDAVTLLHEPDKLRGFSKLLLFRRAFGHIVNGLKNIVQSCNVFRVRLHFY